MHPYRPLLLILSLLSACGAAESAPTTLTLAENHATAAPPTGAASVARGNAIASTAQAPVNVPATR